MDQYEEFHEEVSDEEVQVVPPAPVVVVEPLNVEVPERSLRYLSHRPFLLVALQASLLQPPLDRRLLLSLLQDHLERIQRHSWVFIPRMTW